MEFISLSHYIVTPQAYILSISLKNSTYTITKLLTV